MRNITRAYPAPTGETWGATASRGESLGRQTGGQDEGLLLDVMKQCRSIVVFQGLRVGSGAGVGRGRFGSDGWGFSSLSATRLHAMGACCIVCSAGDAVSFEFVGVSPLTKLST